MQREDPRPSGGDGTQHSVVYPTPVSCALNTGAAVCECVSASIETLRCQAPADRTGASPSASQQAGAVLLSDNLNPFFPDIVNRVQDGARPDNTALHLCDSLENSDE